MIDATVRQYFKLLRAVIESLDPNAFLDVRSAERAIADVALARLEDGSLKPDDPLCFPDFLRELVRRLGRGELSLFDERTDPPPRRASSRVRRRARTAPPSTPRESFLDSPSPD